MRGGAAGAGWCWPCTQGWLSLQLEEVLAATVAEGKVLYKPRKHETNAQVGK